jgi:hypothetical protein
MKPPDSLSALLSRIVERQAERDSLAASLKSIEKELESLEGLATEGIKASGLDGCRVAGKTWWVDETLLLSVPKENRDAVMAAAEREGIAEELVTVNTATLKSWLIGRVKDSGGSMEEATSGTAFEGLVDEYIKVRLRSRTMG